MKILEKLRKGLQRELPKSEDAAVEWLESSYDEWMDFRIKMGQGRLPFPSITPRAREYMKTFSTTHSSGLASIKHDHQSLVQGRCADCEQYDDLIVIE